MLADRQLSPLYVPTVVTVGLLVTIVGFAATIWTIAQQRDRWAVEDARNSPRFRFTISNTVPLSFAPPFLVVPNKSPFASAIRLLTESERECLLLRAGGLRYREIGEVLGIAVSTVGDTVERAIKKLAEKCNV